MHKRKVNNILALIILIVSLWYLLSYGKNTYTFYGDAMGYYMYLPTTFIYHNHKALDWLPPDKHYDHSTRNYLKVMRETYQRTPKGYFVNQYTYGVAFFEMPFFFIAHAYEKITGREANGYTATYQNMIKVSSLFYAIVGLIILFRILKYYFDTTISLLGTIVIFLGTNLFWFSLAQAGMAHVPLFFLYALLIYLTIRLHKTPTLFLFITAGITAGFITVIRPSDILCLLIPLLYNAYSKETIKDKFIFLTGNIDKIVCFSIAFLLPIVPQLLYWKKFAGSFLYDTYTRLYFDWLHPHVLLGFFSFSNGWLIYSPIMIFSIIGLFLYKKIKPWALAVFIVFIIYIYVIYCWKEYFYINGLGSRPMVNIYSLLAIPLTAFLQYISKRKVIYKFVFSLFLLFFITLNICYSIQQVKGILNSEESNSAYTLHMLFKTSANYNDLLVYDVRQVQPNPNKVEKLSVLACENYEDSVSDHYIADTVNSGKYVYHMLADEEYHPKTIRIKYDKSVFKNAQWLRCSGTFMCTKEYVYYKHLLTISIKHGDKFLLWEGCKIDNKIGLPGDSEAPEEYNLGHKELNKWGDVYFFVKIPATISDGDEIMLDVWNIGKQEMYMDNICLELYANKNQ